MAEDKIKDYLFSAALLFVGISILINSFQSNDVYIDYNVSVSENSTGANLQEVKFACYKLCVEELSHDSNKMETCLDKCELLGD